MMQTFAFWLLSCLIQAGASAPADSKPLPELNSFLQNIRKHLHKDSTLQSHYTYTERTIVRQLGSDGRARQTDTRIYEIYPSIEEQLTYRRLISKNEKPLSAEEMKKQDNEFDKKRRELASKRERETPSEKQRREAKEKEAQQEEEKDLDEAFRLYNVMMIGREEFEGIPVILLSFEPRPEYKAKTESGKILSKVHGKAWFTEEDQELVRIEIELRDNLSFGLGMLAKINKGTHIVFQRHQVNDEIWLPAEVHFGGKGRIMLFKGFHVEQETAFSDYKKFSVETLSKIQPTEPRP